MSATNCTQPAVKPPCCLLEEDVTSTSLLDDVDAQRVTSNPSPPLSDNSPNPPGVTPPLDDANASSIERGTSGPADNVDISSLERSLSRLLLDAHAAIEASSAHQGISTAAPTDLKSAAARAARQSMAEASMRLQCIADEIKEMFEKFLDPAEPSSASGASGPSLALGEAPGGAELQGIIEPIHAITPQTRRLILESWSC